MLYTRQQSAISRVGSNNAMMHKGTFPRANRSARKRTLVHHRAETLRVEKIGALSDPARSISIRHEGVHEVHYVQRAVNMSKQRRVVRDVCDQLV